MAPPKSRGKARVFSQDIMRGEYTPGDAAKPRYDKTTGLLIKNDSGKDPRYYYKKQDAEKLAGRSLTNEEFEAEYYDGPDTYVSGTSIFDPVLCELVYRWFAPPGGSVLDPFAGGSVRGIVAGKLGLRYTGIELRPEQVAANRAQLADIFKKSTAKGAKSIPAGSKPAKTAQHGNGAQPGAEAAIPADTQTLPTIRMADKEILPEWLIGDAMDAAQMIAKGAKSKPPYDLLFTCPPYGDLEVYSDDPLDLSTMPYDAFIESMRAIIKAGVSMLKPSAFAVMVVGDFRDRGGWYRGFPADVQRAFADVGMKLYNEAILVTSVGSLSVRVGRAFQSMRKLGKTHQNVLIFYRGNPQDIKAFGDVQAGTGDDGAAPAAADPTQAQGPDMSQGPDGARQVKISAASARQPFNGCDPGYIANVCKARCCESSTHPLGIVVTVHPSEQAQIRAMGGVVVDGLLQPKPGCKKCPFKTSSNLCGIHDTPAKPFGCIASPFTLNPNDTLIVRNRYRLLKCYDDGKKLPAYVAFRGSLDLIFGKAEAERICAHLSAGGGDLLATMSADSYEKLHTNDAIKHAAVKAPAAGSQ